MDYRKWHRARAESWAAKAENWAETTETWAAAMAKEALSTTGSSDVCPLCDMGDQELAQGFCRLCRWEEKQERGTSCEVKLKARLEAKLEAKLRDESYRRNAASREKAEEEGRARWAKVEASRAAERATPAWRKAAAEAATRAWWGRTPERPMRVLYVRFDGSGVYHDRYWRVA
jgi:hypothetical protein